jgi:putative cardiolipin synthase
MTRPAHMPRSAFLCERTEALERIRPPGHSGFRLLLSGLDAFRARAEMIRQAQFTLDLQYYITHDGLSTRLLLDELLQAAERGVRIRVLLDDLASEARDRRVILACCHPNIQLRVFNPPRLGIRHTFTRRLARLLAPCRQHRRMHNKLLLADRSLAVTGGRNLGDDYYGVEDETNFTDVDLLAAGPVARALTDSFEQYWDHSLSMPVDQQVVRATADDRRWVLQAELAEACDRQPRRAEQLAAYLVCPQLDHWLENLVWAPAQAFWDPPDKMLAKNTPKPALRMVTELQHAIHELNEELLIVSSYFVPKTIGVDFFRRLTAAGVSVGILTNALESNDVPLVHGGYAPCRQALLHAGVRLFETRQQPRTGSAYNLSGTRASLHSKAAVFDRRQVFIGPLNLDPRSVLWNTEVGVLMESPVLAEAVRQLILKGMSAQVSYRLQLATGGRLTWHTEDENGRTRTLRREPGTYWQRLNAWAGRWLGLQNLL